MQLPLLVKAPYQPCATEAHFGEVVERWGLVDVWVRDSNCSTGSHRELDQWRCIAWLLHVVPLRRSLLSQGCVFCLW